MNQSPNHPKPLAKAYIDGANMLYSQKKMGWNIEWRKVRSYLEQEYSIAEFRYYTGIKQGDSRMEGFLRYIRFLGFNTITKPLKEIIIDQDHPNFQLYGHTTIYKANFDVEITTDILLDQSNLDFIILFSGDSDFAYLSERLRGVGKSMVVYAARRCLSYELKMACARHIYLDNIRSSIEKS